MENVIQLGDAGIEEGQSLLCAFTIGYLARHFRHADRLPGRVLDGRSRDRNVNQPSVLGLP